MQATASSGRVVLVTGASSGFGRAIAEALSADGFLVFGSLRSPAATPPSFRTVTMDVNRDASVAAAVAEVLRSAGRIDALINNAGVGLAGAIEDTSIEEAQAQFETNFFGTHRVCRALLPHLRAQGRGYIINMSSLAGRVSIPFQGIYSATKFAIEAYSEALRMEVRPFGIQVSMIEPGDFATSFTANRRRVAADGPGSPYHAACHGAVAQMAREELANRDLAPVIQAIRTVLRTSAPRLRYPCATTSQRLSVVLRRFLPDATWESIMRRTYRLS